MGDDDYFYDGGEHESKSEGSQEEGSGRPPLLYNRDEGATCWLNQDKNGNYYVNLDLGFLGSFPLFVNKVYRDAFNRFVEHVKDQE